nr:LysM peptidoglycan-binding domain-containing protein [Cloacibacterium sp.]
DSDNLEKNTNDYLFHAVNAGDTLSLIANIFKISTNELKKINGLKNEKIYLGQVLKLKNKETIKEFEKKNREKELKKETEKITLADEKFSPVNVNYSFEGVEFPYEKSEFRDTYYMDFGFTTDLRLSDGLFYCLNGIC